MTAPEKTGLPPAVNAETSKLEPKLGSWKEIAAYLERDERTVKRWEKSRGLPVRRLPGGRGGVFAFRAEIDSWQRGSTSRAEEDLGEEAATVQIDEIRAEALDTQLPGLPEEPTSSHNGQDGRLGRGRLLAYAGFILALVLAAISFAHSPKELHSARAPSVVPDQARNLYLSGRFYWNKRTPADLKLALRDFQASNAIRPNAAAYAGIAECYGLATEYASMPPNEAYPRMLAAAQQAVALDANLAEGHRALGFVSFYWNWDRAESRREFERALAIDGKDATTLHWYANILQQMQDVPDAMRMIDKARELDPTSPPILADRGLILSMSGQQKEAEGEWQKLERSDPSYLPPHWYRGSHALGNHDPTTYIGELRSIAGLSRSRTDEKLLTLCEQAYRHHGEAGLFEALAEFKVRDVERNRIGYLDAARYLDMAHRKDESLAYVQLAYVNRDPTFPTLTNLGAFSELNDSPQFKELKLRSIQPFPENASAILPMGQDRDSASPTTQLRISKASDSLFRRSHTRSMVRADKTPGLSEPY